jgi:hypothetical protein
MLYINVLKVGELHVNQPLLFDTGSSGMTIDCHVIVPEPQYNCMETGIKIPKDMELGGVKITKQKVIMRYGTYDEYGNLAYANVSIGSSENQISTVEPIPILIRYKKVRRSNGEVVGGPLWPKGIFGTSPIGGGGPNQVIKSPLEAMTVNSGMMKGYFITPVGTEWKVCTNEERNCPEVAALHLGIHKTIKDEFKNIKWKIFDKRANFPTVDACIAWERKIICQHTLFDTGNSTIQVGLNTKKKHLETGVEMLVSKTSLFEWRFSTEYQPEVEFLPQNFNIVGIRYFETNSYLIDIDAKEIGFRIGK